MNEINDIKLLLKSGNALMVIETNEEPRLVSMFQEIAAGFAKPLYRWTVTTGLTRLEEGYGPQRFNLKPIDVLSHIKSTKKPGIFLLLDFHPFMDDPHIVRTLREIAQNHGVTSHHLVMISPSFELPEELQHEGVRFNLSLPDHQKLTEIIADVAHEYVNANQGQKVQADQKAVALLARNLSGLTISDAKRLARKAIFDDGAITQSDMHLVMQAKYELINQKGVLSFEYDTASFSEVGGLAQLKNWLTLRKRVFLEGVKTYGLEAPKGILLLGVQGCGKSLAAKATAGVWNVPLLRLDFGSLYDKYYGETERNLRESLKTAEVMAPCVLWIDEIEKGISSDSGDGGLPKRVLGALLTWMNERKRPVFIVATANDISALPPELMRKGRVDEIFFVDLPNQATRALIFEIQLKKKHIDPANFDLDQLARLSNGFSGAEIEQVVVSACYTAVGYGNDLNTDTIIKEIQKTQPLSVVMKEKIDALRAWAKDRTVPAN
jgi:SpoVK/Ycf46/Vps4 family AAA+-type ATPase